VRSLALSTKAQTGRSGIRRLGRWAQEFASAHRLDPFPFREVAAEGYGKTEFRSDARAGINVALLAFPQGLAYAAIAGLPIVYGVTCSIVAALVAPLLTSSRFTILGPTNATAFMIFSFFVVNPNQDPVKWMSLIILMAGLALVVGAFLRLADLMQYISRSVVIGYVTGAAVLIIANQARHVLGIDFSNLGEGVDSPRTFFGVVWANLRLLPQLDAATAVLGIGTLVVFLLLNRRLAKLPLFAIVLVIMSLIAWFMQRGGAEIVTYREQAFPTFAFKELLPSPIPIRDHELVANIGRFFGLSMAIAFLAAMEQSVMSQNLGSRTGRRNDKNQDLLGVGASNLACAVMSGMPASGSLTRSALNFSSGAKTRVSSLLAAGLCLIGALTLGPSVAYIPKAVLAALVICVAGSLISPRNIRICLRATLEDRAVVITTLLSTLILPLHVAIFVGVGTSIVLYLRQAARPHLVEYEFNAEGDLAERAGKRTGNPSISIVHVEGELFFGAAELFRTQIQRTCQDPDLKVIVLRLKNARHLDATSVMALEDLIRFLRDDGRHLIVSGAMKDVYRVFKNADLLEVLGRENFFLGSTRNPTLATRNALKRAQELLGTDQAEIKIYFDPNADTEKKPTKKA